MTTPTKLIIAGAAVIIVASRGGEEIIHRRDAEKRRDRGRSLIVTKTRRQTSPKLSYLGVSASRRFNSL